MKVTLSFDEEIINKAKAYADAHNISLSRLTEILYRKLTAKSYASLEDIEIADWVNMVAEGPAVYRRKPRKSKELKTDYFENRRS